VDEPVPPWATDTAPDRSASTTAELVVVWVDPATCKTPAAGEEATMQVGQLIVPVVVIGPPLKGAVVATLETDPVPPPPPQPVHVPFTTRLVVVILLATRLLFTVSVPPVAVSWPVVLTTGAVVPSPASPVSLKVSALEFTDEG